MKTLGVTFLTLALLFAVVGGCFLLLSRFGVKRLPGDMVFDRGNVIVYVPIGLMIVVSVLLTIVLNLWRR